MITVANIKSVNPSPTAVYIGRPMPGRPGSPLANPFKITPTASRADVIAQYKRRLWAEMNKPSSPALRELHRLADLVRNGQDVTLLCWCSPKPCHGDVVKAAVEYLLSR